MRVILWTFCCLLCWSGGVYAQTTENSSKIEGYGVLDAVGPRNSKLEGYSVLDAIGPGASKITGYAVLCCAGPAVSKIDSYAVLQSLIVPYSEDAAKLEQYAVLLDPSFPPPPPPGGGGSPGPVCVTPSIDFSIWNNAYPFKFASPATDTITSTKPNEIIYVTFSSIDFDSANNAPPVVTGIHDVAALSWARKGVSKSYSCTAGTGGCFPGDSGALAQVSIDTFWAYSAGILTGDTISIDFTTTGASGNARWNFNAVGVLNVGNFVTPFDTDPSLPAYDSDMSGTPGSASVTFSTASPATTVIGTCFTFNAGTTQCGGHDWTTLSSAGVTPTAVLFQYSKSFQSMVSSLTAPLNGSTTNQWWATQANAFISNGGAGCQNSRPWVWIEQ